MTNAFVTQPAGLIHDDDPEIMALRDYFAGKTLVGMLSDSEGINEDTGDKLSIPNDAELIATCCYAMADAMIKAREQNGNNQ
jgi:hypothetical protein